MKSLNVNKHSGWIVVILIAGVLLVLVGLKQGKVSDVSKPIEEPCPEGLSKTVNKKEIYTCVGGKWIYTGLLDEVKNKG